MSMIAQAVKNTTDIIINGITFTNDNKVPYEIAVFAAYHSTLYSGNPPREGKLSTTTIIGPLRKALLAIKYPDTGTQDVSTLLASAKGTCMHEGLTKALNAHNSGYICEQRIEREVNGWKISGEFDVLTPNKQIKDFKFVSNYNIKKLIEDKEKLQPEWSMEEMYLHIPTYFKYAAQLSIYRFLLNDPEIQPYGSILFSLNNGSDMGKYTIDQEVTFSLFPNEQVEEYLFNQVAIIKQHLLDGTLPLCSNEERGYKPGEWKLQRMGTTGKMATVRGSKCNSAAELAEFITKSGRAGDVEVVVPPEYTLCNYCKFQSICDQNLS